MKILFVAGAVLFLVSQFLYQAYAVEICEPQDYYNLIGTTNCSIQYGKAGNKADPRDAMFEIMQNYPFEKKDVFARLLRRKIELIDSYEKQHQQGQTGKVKTNISKLEQAKQDLSGQLGMVNTATRDNWVSVRDRARKALEETAKRLREVE
jgi:hypothetical protein